MCAQLSGVSAESVSTSRDPDATMEMAHTTLGKNPPGLCGPFLGRMFLILIDAHSKGIEAFCTIFATSSATMEILRQVFAQFGVQETVVTDHGTCFTSDEFKMFLKINRIRHLTTAPYHPASNGVGRTCCPNC